MSITTIILNVGGMSCMGCVNSIKNLLSAVPGVQGVNVDLATGQVKVDYDDAQAGKEDLRRAIEEGGYTVSA